MANEAEPSASATPGEPEAAGHGSRVRALAAGALAAGYLALALFAPALLLAAIPLVMGAACTLAAGRKPRRRAFLIVASWLAIGVAGAWWWRSDPSAGLWWVVGALFVLPLPIVPWVYAAWFEERA
ncbi:MAG TPA: hypothetical protein P5234_07190 [Thermoanaerobaculaceae bacterium]|mgnify:CR=1 FL=1|nr:hypothetical protein [Thermoanaerobaculaceae bacterium]HRS16022.1 hypothetical protein [Thermoanaerobaculaceae bacterium]